MVEVAFLTFVGVLCRTTGGALPSLHDIIQSENNNLFVCILCILIVLLYAYSILNCIFVPYSVVAFPVTLLD